MARPGSSSVKTCRQLGPILFTVIASLWACTALGAEAPPCDLAKQQSVVINFFIHDDLDVKPVSSAITTVKPISPLNGSPNTNLFGSIAVIDDSITEGPNVSSKELARGRGFYVFDYLQKGLTGLEFVFTAVFNNESGYGGSTLTFKGTDRIDEVYREIAITGGTGQFRLARGWAGILTYYANGGAAILNTTCYVYYGCGQSLAGSGSLQNAPSLYTVVSVAIGCVLFQLRHFLISCHH